MRGDQHAWGPFPGAPRVAGGRVGGYRALRRKGWKFSLTQHPRPGPAPDSGKRELGGGRSRVLTALSLGGLPLSLGVVSRAVPPAAPAPFSPPESHRWGRVALGTAAGSPQPRLRCGQAPVPPPLPGACTGEAVLLQGGEMAKIRGRLPGLRSAPRGTANAPCRRIARGDRGLPRGGTAGAERTEAPRPPQPARLVRPQPGAGPRDMRLLGEEKKKNYTHAQKMRFLCAGARRGHGVGAGELEEVSEPPRHPPASPLLRTGPDRTAPGLRGGQAGVAGGCHHPGEKLRRSQLPGRRGRVRPAGGCARRGAGRYLWRRAAFICI